MRAAAARRRAGPRVAVHTAITRLLAGHGLEHVAVERAAEPPEQSPGGKHRTVIPPG
jgi:hypothetical protein